MATSNPGRLRIYQKMRDKKKLRGGKQKLIPIQKFCEGTIRSFQGQRIPKDHEWKSRCPHLKLGPVCGLLKKRAFSKLCNPKDARCTLPELVLYCDWFLDDYLGSYFRSEYEIRASDGNLKDQVQIEKSHKVPVEETLEMVPDYKTALKDLLNSTSNWKWEDTPKSWSIHIKIQAHKYIRKFVTEQIPCGNCCHYSHIQNLCLQKDKKKRHSSRGCHQFRPIPVESAYVPRQGELKEIHEQIIERAEVLLAREATKAQLNNPKRVDQLERIHSIVLYLDEKNYDEVECLKRLAKEFGLSEKTILRDKKEMVRLLQILKETDTVLKKLFDRSEMLADIPPDILEELEEAE